MRFYNFYISHSEKILRQVRCILLFLLLFASGLVSAELLINNQTVFICAVFVAGWFLWTFTEYILHRFWMHGHGKAGSYHTHHHTHPTEIKVTPLQRTLMLIIVTVVGWLAVRVHAYLMLFDGFLFGFAAYCCMHWVLHQSWSRKLFPRLHRFHIYHHCKFPDSCYGVTVTWWDLIFGTIPPAQSKLSNRIISFYYGDGQTQKQQPKNMKSIIKKHVLIISLVLATAPAFAATIDTFPFSPKPQWKTRVVFNDGTMLNGFATSNTDSTITMIIPQRDSAGQKITVTIPFTDIKKIRIRDRHSMSVAENMLAGAGVGFLLGFLLGVQDCDDPDSDCTFIENLFSNSRAQNAVKLGAAFSVIGLGAGLIGSEKVTFKFKLGKNKKKKVWIPVI